MDARRDLYDQAFALFGLAHARSVDPAAADKRIRQILSYLDTQRLPPGGFLEGEIAPRPRRQNPHMHLFEAGIALAEAGFAQGEHLAEEMVELFRRHFFDGPSSSLGEFYDDHLRSAHGEPGQVTEPGHHFEWIWLLDRWARLTGKAHHNESLALWGHATRNGIMGPVAIDETWRSGGVKAPTARLWPQTERLKAGLVLWEATGEPNFAADAVVAYRGLRIFLDGVRPGLWWDRLTEDLTPLEELSPASSFYHITLALAELNRVCVSA